MVANRKVKHSSKLVCQFNDYAVGHIHKVTRAKVAVFTSALDVAQTETKGTVLIKNADEMLNFTSGEEKYLEKVRLNHLLRIIVSQAFHLLYVQIIKEIADSGVKVIVAGSSVGELAMHYINRFNIAVLRVLSKFELRRLCRVVNATPLARMGAPTPDEAGFVDVFETVEIGGDRVTVLRQLVDGDEGFNPQAHGGKTRTATIVLRGATSNRLDDLERAVDDGVNVIKSLMKDPRLVPGAGASELELARRVETYGSGLKGLAQHAVKRYAQSLEVVPRTLAENAMGGAEGNEVLSRLWAKHEQKGGEGWGVDVEVLSPLLSTQFIDSDHHCRLKQMGHCRLMNAKFTTRSLQKAGRSNWRRRQQFRCLVLIALS